ncbi:AMIN-like domain-containing (lipo)protein [Demequina sp. SO4-18]|uniref:AMIN-like domain-containing (lipo)protein n=1 Tax=Demequina sp. SO4-18 TaxID=3401026 RepID=UPI003B5B1FD8
MRRDHLIRVFALAAAGAMVVAGCSTEDPQPTVTATETTSPEPPQASASPTPSSSPSPSASASEAPLPDEDPPADAAPFPADRAPDTAEAGSDSRLSPVDLRFGVHDGFDRIVLDLAGEGAPGWDGRYVEDPTQAASGEPVYLLGEDYLLILVNGVVYPTEDGAQDFDGPRSLTPTAGGVVEEVRYGAMFEGQVEVWVGLASDEPFRVFSLEDPTRVVIDVQHP